MLASDFIRFIPRHPRLYLATCRPRVYTTFSASVEQESTRTASKREPWDRKSATEASPPRDLEHFVALLVAHNVMQVKRARIPRDRDRVHFAFVLACVCCIIGAPQGSTRGVLCTSDAWWGEMGGDGGREKLPRHRGSRRGEKINRFIIVCKGCVAGDVSGLPPAKRWVRPTCLARGPAPPESPRWVSYPRARGCRTSPLPNR